MPGEPILAKVPPDPARDHHLLTWERFLALRAWAQRVADAEGHPIYLVGSALTKDRPRDIDVSIIVPHDLFVARFGPIPPDGLTADVKDVRGMSAYMNKLAHYVTTERSYRLWALKAGLCDTRLDLKICPDSWWPDNDKLLLATPSPKG